MRYKCLMQAVAVWHCHFSRVVEPKRKSSVMAPSRCCCATVADGGWNKIKPIACRRPFLELLFHLTALSALAV